jgi:hypothetical protein
VIVVAELVERDDAGMVEPRGGDRLALNARVVAVVACERDHLDRHVALEPLVVGLPDDAEAPRSEPLAEPVATEHEPARRRFAKPLGAGVARNPDRGVGPTHLGSVFGPRRGAPAALPGGSEGGQPMEKSYSFTSGPHARKRFSPCSTNRTSQHPAAVARPASGPDRGAPPTVRP